MNFVLVEQEADVGDLKFNWSQNGGSKIRNTGNKKKNITEEVKNSVCTICFYHRCSKVFLSACSHDKVANTFSISVKSVYKIWQNTRINPQKICYWVKRTWNKGRKRVQISANMIKDIFLRWWMTIWFLAHEQWVSLSCVHKWTNMRVVIKSCAHHGKREYSLYKSFGYINSINAQPTCCSPLSI